jgi:hypothetical protein
MFARRTSIPPRFIVWGLITTLAVPLATFAQIEGEAVYLFDFEDLSGVDLLDRSTNANDGVLHNGPTFSTDVPPISGADYTNNRSIVFSGTGGTSDPHVRIIDTTAGGSHTNIDLSAGDISIEAWVKPMSGFPRGQTIFQSAEVRNISQKSVGLRIGAGDSLMGQLRWTLADGPGAQEVNLFSGSENQVPVGTWTHVASILDRSGVNGIPNRAYVFLDGVQIASADSSALGDPHTDGPAENYVMAVGCEFFTANILVTESMDALVDEFRLIKRAFTFAEVLDHSISTISGFIDPGEPKTEESVTAVALQLETSINVDYLLESTSDPTTGLWDSEPYTVQGTGNEVNLRVPADSTKIYRFNRPL